jgi:transcriptional regulator with XRE-family HTH domain
MSVNSGNNLATGHFGRQMRKERMAHGWTLREFADKTRIDFTTLSRIETGKRPPNQKVAAACDRVFPERRDYFTDLYDEMRTWAPPGFRDWPEIEIKTTRLNAWSPGVFSGLLQTEDYASALLATLPGASAEAVKGRLANRISRQQHVLHRNDPPAIRFIVDELALYRRVGGAEVMAQQLRHVSEVASLPHVTLQALPATAHPATASGFFVADDAAYVEHVLGGGVYTDEQTVTTLAVLFDTLRNECYRVSESLAIIRRAESLWTGERAATAAHRAASA